MDLTSHAKHDALTTLMKIGARHIGVPAVNVVRLNDGCDKNFQICITLSTEPVRLQSGRNEKKRFLGFICFTSLVYGVI